MAKYSCVVCGKETKSSECCYQGGDRTCVCLDCRDGLKTEIQQLNSTKEAKDFQNEIKSIFGKYDSSSDLQSFFHLLSDEVVKKIEKLEYQEKVLEARNYVRIFSYMDEVTEHSSENFYDWFECLVYDMKKKGFDLKSHNVTPIQYTDRITAHGQTEFVHYVVFTKTK